MKTYTMMDGQSTDVFKGLSMDELREFMNEIFWDVMDDTDAFQLPEASVIECLETCDYIIEEE